MDFLLSAAGGDNGLGASLAAEGITASCEYVRVMTETIEQSRRELFVAEHLHPLGERQIGGDYGRASFVALGELHRRGKRIDPQWEDTALSAPRMFERGLELIG